VSAGIVILVAAAFRINYIWRTIYIEGLHLSKRRLKGKKIMIFVENYNTVPYMNHALEEWLMDNFEEDCFMLWRNDTAILLGKNQNAYGEIDMEYAREHQIKIVRRITGGGTVFTDPGNIMFTFISVKGKEDFSDFKKFTMPILKALQSLGIQAQFSGRNDLEIAGQKFSGNAQCRYKGKVLHHGTLMYQADVSKLAKALKVKAIKLKNKGVSSVKSRVTNIADHMEKPMDIEEFRSYLFESVIKDDPNARKYTLSKEQWKEVEEKSIQKYASKEWIYGRCPNFDLVKETKFPGGIVEVFLDVKRGIVERTEIYGDFFSDGEIREVELALQNTFYEKEAIKEKLKQFQIERYFKNIGIDELVTAFI
jgi:lipoate-protein ligase A